MYKRQVQYLKEIRPGGVLHLKPPRIRRPGQVMLLDEMTRRNLELIEPLRTGEEGGTLLDVLDVTTTPMGGRLLRRWVLEPLIHMEDIAVRHGAVEEFVERPEVRSRIRGSLSGITDLERLAGKVGTGRVTPRDLAGLRSSLDQLPARDQAVSPDRTKLSFLLPNLWVFGFCRSWHFVFLCCDSYLPRSVSNYNRHGSHNDLHRSGLNEGRTCV